MNLNKTQLKELINELINFTDKKVLMEEMTTKGSGDLKYRIYTNTKEEYYYRDYLLKGAIGHGNLTKNDVGIAFLSTGNKITNGVYIYIGYRYLKNEIYLKLGSSHETKNVISPNKKNLFNNEYQKSYNQSFNYDEIVEWIEQLLEKFRQEIL